MSKEKILKVRQEAVLEEVFNSTSSFTDLLADAFNKQSVISALKKLVGGVGS